MSTMCTLFPRFCIHLSCSSRATCPYFLCFSSNFRYVIMWCLRAMLHTVFNVFFSDGPKMDCFTLFLNQSGTNISLTSYTHMYHEDGGSCCNTFQIFPPTVYSIVIQKKKQKKKGLHCINVQWNQDFLSSRPGKDEIISMPEKVRTNMPLTHNIPSLARQRCLPSWGPRRTPWFFFL